MREHQDLVFISQNGMVQRTGVKGISKQGRPAQGVRLMNLSEDDQVSAVALVIESTADTAAPVTGDAEGPLTEAEDAALGDGPVIGAPLPEGDLEGGDDLVVDESEDDELED